MRSIAAAARLLPVLLVAALAACADPGAPRIVADGDDRIVLASFRGDDFDPDSWAVARAHCAASGRVALLGGQVDKGRAIKRRYLCTSAPEDGAGVTYRAGR
jgi:hypothetical protein